MNLSLRMSKMNNGTTKISKRKAKGEANWKNDVLDTNKHFCWGKSLSVSQTAQHPTACWMISLQKNDDVSLSRVIIFLESSKQIVTRPSNYFFRSLIAVRCTNRITNSKSPDASSTPAAPCANFTIWARLRKASRRVCS